MKIVFTAVIPGCVSNSELLTLLAKDVEDGGCGAEAAWNCKVEFKETDSKIVIKTAWSQFVYELEYQDEVWNCTYVGAMRGFLRQNLLPQFREVFIHSVEGTYGQFGNHSNDPWFPLKHYAGIKKAWEKVFLEQYSLPQVAATMWKQNNPVFYGYEADEQITELEALNEQTTSN